MLGGCAKKPSSPVCKAELENSHLRLVFDPDTFTLRELEDRDLRASYTFRSPVVWRMSLRAPSGSLRILTSSEAPPGTFECAPGSLVFRWQVPDAAAVEATVTLPPSERLARWRIRVTPSGTESLWTVDYPVIEPDPLETDRSKEFLAYPEYSGRLVGNPAAGFSRDISPAAEEGVDGYLATLGLYGGTVGMQFMAYYGGRGGIYLTTQDPDLYVKRLGARGDGSRLSLYIRHFPDHMLQAAPYAQPYEVVLGGFAGDWLDAAKLYREWAVAQPWTRPGPLAERADLATAATAPRFTLFIPPATPLVGDNAATLAVVDEFRSIYSELPPAVALAYHQQQWWRWGFDRGLPDYFPPLPGTAALLSAIRARGLQTQVYFNTLGWDPELGTARGPTDMPFSLAKPHVARTSTGAQVTRSFPDGSFAVVCHADAWWAEQVAAALGKLAATLPVDGFYLDNYPNATLCFGEGHGHSPGGGSAWLSGFRKLLLRARATVNAHGSRPLTQETPWEGNVGAVDNVLHLLFEGGAPSVGATFSFFPHYVYDSRPVPLFAAVYHDYVGAVGPGNIRMSSGVGPQQVAYAYAASFVTGLRLGFTDIGFLAAHRAGTATPQATQAMAYAGELARWQARLHPTLLLGELLRPPALVAPTISMAIRGREVDVPAVLAGAFRLATVIVVVLTNPTPVSRSVDVDWTAVPAPEAKVIEVTAAGESTLPGGLGSLAHLNLPPGGTRAFRWKTRP